jgi:hypothetical protein
MVHDAGPQAELPCQRCIGQIDAPAFLRALQDRSVQLIQRGLVNPACPTIAEADCAQLSTPYQLELRLSLYRLGEAAGVRQVFSDRLAKRCQAVIAERKPKLQSSKSARELQRLFKESKSLDGICAQRTRVVAAMGKGFLRCF